MVSSVAVNNTQVLVTSVPEHLLIPSMKKDILSVAEYQERVKLDAATNVFVAVLQPSTSPTKSAAQNLTSFTSGPEVKEVRF